MISWWGDGAPQQPKKGLCVVWLSFHVGLLVALPELMAPPAIFQSPVLGYSSDPLQRQNSLPVIA